MKVALRAGNTQVHARFDPDKIKWKSKNFGWFTPDGVYFPEIDNTLFVNAFRENRSPCRSLNPTWAHHVPRICP